MIATPGNVPSIAAKAATATVPIVFGVGDDPVRLGLVASLARPGGNATGINLFVTEVTAKRLWLLHDLVPKAVRIAVLVNPTNDAETTLREVQEAARIIGLQIQVLNARTIGEIDAAFATLAHDRPDALFVAGDAFFLDRRVQFATLTARERIPATYSVRELTAAGGLMSYGPTSRTSFITSASIPVASSRAPSPPTCQWCNRLNLSSSLTCKRHEPSASTCRLECSQSPMR